VLASFPKSPEQSLPDMIPMLYSNCSRLCCWCVIVQLFSLPGCVVPHDAWMCGMPLQLFPDLVVLFLMTLRCAVCRYNCFHMCAGLVVVLVSRTCLNPSWDMRIMMLQVSPQARNSSMMKLYGNTHGEHRSSLGSL
jgi:hypothetical protein